MARVIQRRLIVPPEKKLILPTPTNVFGDQWPMSEKQIYSIVESSAKVNLWSGSARSGKTIGSLVKFLYAVSKAPREGEIVLVSQTIQSAYRNLIAPLQNPDMFGKLSDFVKYTQNASSAIIMGRRVHVLGAHDAKAEKKVRGMTISVAYIDEATLVSQDFWNQVITRMSVPGAQLFATTNPDNPNHWLRREWILANKEPKIFKHFVMNLDDNPFNDEDYKEMQKAAYSGLFYRRFILGEWVSGEGAIFDCWDPDIHVWHGELPQITKWIGVGADSGTTNPTVGILGGVGIDGRIYLVDEYRYGGASEELPARSDLEHSMEIQKWLIHSSAPMGLPVYLDPAAASLRVQLYQDGLKTKLANNKVRDGIELMTSLMRADKLRVMPKCQGFISEVSGYSWDPKATEQGKDLPVKLHDHSMDASRYLIRTSYRYWRNYVGLNTRFYDDSDDDE